MRALQSARPLKPDDNEAPLGYYTHSINIHPKVN